MWGSKYACQKIFSTWKQKWNLYFFVLLFSLTEPKIKVGRTGPPPMDPNKTYINPGTEEQMVSQDIVNWRLPVLLYLLGIVHIKNKTFICPKWLKISPKKVAYRSKLMSQTSVCCAGTFSFLSEYHNYYPMFQAVLYSMILFHKLSESTDDGNAVQSVFYHIISH